MSADSIHKSWRQTCALLGESYQPTLVLMELPTLESVFAQLVQQTDTERVARDVVGVMQVRHA